MNVVNVMSANAYGPGDHFDSPHPHVIPATIQKCMRDRELVVWGDGTPTRDFLFVEDIAEGLVLAAEHLEAPGHVNLGSDAEISIGDLVRLIARLTGFDGPIRFDPSKGGGDPRRATATGRAKELLGFAARVPLEEGLRRTVAWYREKVARS
jgi:GDP-L-fucose synthase